MPQKREIIEINQRFNQCNQNFNQNSSSKYLSQLPVLQLIWGCLNSIEEKWSTKKEYHQKLAWRNNKNL